VQCLPQGVYRPGNAQASPLYRLVEDHFDELERVWDERYEREYGLWRPVVRHVVEQFLDSGDLRCGFARLWCPTCRQDLLLPYSCRRRCFCPSCHQKRALLGREKISPHLVERMRNWVHPGFSVFQGEAIAPDDHEARRRLAGYMVHPPIALERLRYRPDTGQVIYYGRQRGRNSEAEASPARIFPALDFLAALCTHVPDSGQQPMRYYGAFSNARRVSAEAPVSASAHPAEPQPRRQDDSDSGEEFARARRRSWARLIKKVYQADPRVCPRCSGPLTIISLIGDAPVIEKILRHLKLCSGIGD
jgi:hypothetical protein